jgi:microcystin-dependent protein
MNNKLTVKKNSKSRRGFLQDLTKWIGGTAFLAATANLFTSNKVKAEINSTNPFIGEIMLVGFGFAPEGWAFCNGQLLQISSNSALFSLLGTTYGGDGEVTFGLPDLRGRVPVHVGGFSGTGPGLSQYNLGQKGGTETVTLTPQQMPSHNHLLNVNSSGGNSNTPTNNYIASNSEGIKHYSDTAGSTANSANIGNTGGGSAHNNIQPYQGVNYVIAIVGTFPSPT